MTDLSVKKILIVDDNPVNINLLKKHLPGYNFATTTDGASAAALAEYVKPDLIILDIMMPVKDGFAVAEELKEIPEAANIPILFVSAKTNVRRMIKDSNLDPNEFLEAPYDPKVLRNKVENRLNVAEVSY